MDYECFTDFTDYRLLHGTYAHGQGKHGKAWQTHKRTKVGPYAVRLSSFSMFKLPSSGDCNSRLFLTRLKLSDVFNVLPCLALSQCAMIQEYAVMQVIRQRRVRAMLLVAVCRRKGAGMAP